jgi:hypothetical protein
MVSPGIYNVSNGFMVILLFGQFRWSSCNKLALFSDLSEYHLLGALLVPSLPSRVEREETLNTPLWGGLADIVEHGLQIHVFIGRDRGKCHQQTTCF